MVINQEVFLKLGNKEVIYFTTLPAPGERLADVASRLKLAVENYTNICGKGFNIYYAPNNPFEAIIIHGLC